MCVSFVRFGGRGEGGERGRKGVAKRKQCSVEKEWLGLALFEFRNFFFGTM